MQKIENDVLEQKLKIIQIWLDYRMDGEKSVNYDNFSSQDGQAICG